MKASLLTCNPGTVKATRDTCLPSAMIKRLVNEWNTRHPEKRVPPSQDKHVQWTNLRRQMVTCDTEFCAVKKLVNGKEKKNFQKFFRPEVPTEWKGDPDAWLSTDDIEDVMEQYEDAFPTFEFIGPVPLDFDAKSSVPSWGDCIVDEMCKLDLRKMKSKGTEKIGIVFNFDPHDKPGSHWVAAMLDLKEQIAYYYDSYGKGPPKEINIFFERCKKQGIQKIVFNDIRHQRKMSECGMYAIYFLVSMLFGKSFSEICLDELDDSRMLLLRKIFFSNGSVTKEELDNAFQWFNKK